MSLAIDCEVILLAEDNENHVLLIRRAFEQAGLVNPLYVVSNGEECVAYLSGQGKYAKRDEYPLPCLLLLDLKMPKKDGFEVLEWLQSQPTLSMLRTVVLTTSEELRDVNRAYKLGANSFLTKPIDFRDFVQLTAAVKGYWIWLSRAPQIGRANPKSSQF